MIWYGMIQSMSYQICMEMSVGGVAADRGVVLYRAKYSGYECFVCVCVCYVIYVLLYVVEAAAIISEVLQ